MIDVCSEPHSDQRLERVYTETHLSVRLAWCCTQYRECMCSVLYSVLYSPELLSAVVLCTRLRGSRPSRSGPGMRWPPRPGARGEAEPRRAPRTFRYRMNIIFNIYSLYFL